MQALPDQRIAAGFQQGGEQKERVGGENTHRNRSFSISYFALKLNLVDWLSRT